jgi:hypothetical protein
VLTDKIVFGILMGKIVKYIILLAYGLFYFILIIIICNCTREQTTNNFHRLTVSSNGRFLQYDNGQPFFWLGDTGWLLFTKLNREEAKIYLDDRHKKGFNVIQVMILHSIPAINFYGDSALVHKNPAQPKITIRNNPDSEKEYDYWDHIDFIVDQAATKGIYMAMVPVWGSIVKEGYFTVEKAHQYAAWLAERYKGKSNIIWLNGGDIRGDQYPEIWNAIGETLHKYDKMHLVTFHPFGRTQSSTWFHDRKWLDFNMFQSGHRRYDQRRESDDPATWKGEDNWKYVQEDLLKIPAKPTIDGEPSYENIPQGLHDPSEPYWTAADARRYAYWSVFAGSMGHTYGDNAVMQMHKPEDKQGAYGVRNFWYEAINDSGASQMIYLKNLMLSRPYFERVQDTTLLVDENGFRYDRIMVTRGSSYAFFYTYTGRNLAINLENLPWDESRTWWYNPKNGKAEKISDFLNSDIQIFDPPDNIEQGNDWVLVIDDADKNFSIPGLL